MAKAEFVMLAHKYDPKVHIGGWFMSEKLDGQRAIWDGGITRGLFKNDVPWANTTKDARYVTKPIATGLWSRYGNVIHAPEWFLDLLPRIPLDGELYTRSFNRQGIFSAIKDLHPGPEWKFVQLHVFDFVSEFWLMDRRINNTGFQKSLKGCFQWAKERKGWEYIVPPMTQFQTVVELMKQRLAENDILRVHPQERLPFGGPEAEEMVRIRANEIVESGGEGLILKSPIQYWEPYRSHGMVKFKPTDDAEGTVIGYITGRETDKGSKLLGMMGALVLRLENGNIMELSGFTDGERELGPFDKDARGWAASHPGEPCPEWIEAIAFPRGTKVTFKYRGLSDKGVPQEARYWRQRDD